MTVEDVSPLGAAQSCRIAFPDGTLLVAVLAADTATEAAFKELPKEYRFEEKRG